MKLFSASIVIALCAFAALAQQPSQAPTPDKASDYDTLLAKVKGGDTSIDFKALRIAFTQTKAFGPYGNNSDPLKAAFAALNDRKFKDAAKKAEEVLKDNYVDMEAHVAASTAYSGLGETAKAEFHKAVYLGLVKSILTSGDGKTQKTAYVVITTHEEYVVLRALGLMPGSQSLVNANDGHTFDVLTATDSKTKESIKIYFNIDIPWKAETEMFK